ncbi:MAG: RNA polymerase factor sigma-54 [Alloprevotella sp.]|nr:RNA polymerase factor sigma-54 [Alloprevotella sp.]
MQRLEQTQREEQTQQLHAMQVAMANILELPLMDFQERVRNEMEDNEALEEAGPEEDGYDDASDHDREDEDGSEEGRAEDNALTDETADYLTADDIPDYLLRQQNAHEEREFQYADAGTSYDDLYRQMGEQELSAEEREVLEYLIGSLDADGYLRKSSEVLADELAIYQNVDASPETVERMVRLLQTFEPRGIAARSLQECLQIQLDDPDFTSPHKPLAGLLLGESFRDFAAHHWDVLMQRYGVEREELDAAVRLLTRLNPRPGSTLGDVTTEVAPSVIPDFYVHVENGIPGVSLSRGDVPELRVSRAFRDTLREYAPHRDTLSTRQHNEYIYARKKVNDAQLFIELVRRRQRTLLSVMHSIVQIQEAFFVNDDDEALLVPMVLKDVSQRAGVDLSTISRVTAGKYVQTDWGVYPLRFFFSYQFTSSEGEELSSRQARAMLKEVIDSEDKSRPMTDEKLAAEMKLRGQPISRRTVVKYREMLGIPVARLRKK